MISDIPPIVSRRIHAVTSYVLKKPFLLILLIFLFLLLRNNSVLTLTDVYDGFITKIRLLSSENSIHSYIFKTMLTPYDQHFIPIWFLIILPAYYFNAGPLLMGLVSFGVAATLLYLMFRIIYYFTKDHANGLVYSALVTLVFSSTIFFIEVIAWKWMLCLLISSVFTYLSILIVLEKKRGLRWTVLYTVSLFLSLWSFGTAWVGAWGIALFLILTRRYKDVYTLIAISTAIFGSIVAVIASNSTNNINFGYIAKNLLETLALVTGNLSMHLLGVARFTSVEHTYISSALTGAILSVLIVRITNLYRSNQLSEKSAFLATLATVYMVLIFLSVFRVMSQYGTDQSASLDGYIFGNRYLFVYSIPLVLVLGILMREIVLKLPRNLLYVLIVGGIFSGILTNNYYSQSDTFMTNPDRSKFYEFTPEAIKEASINSITLPNIEGDLFFRNRETKLSDAVKFQKESQGIPVTFMDPTSLDSYQCSSLRDNSKISTWLDLYNKDWCK
jgi:hypothetical protein